MRILLISDLHYRHGSSDKTIESLREAVEREGPDVIACLGDNAEAVPDMSNHRSLFEILRDISEGDIALICGTHDIAGRRIERSAPDLLYGEMTSLTEGFGITYLEFENMQVDGATLVGTYGHFDYSLAKDTGMTLQDAMIQRRNEMNLDWEGIGNEEMCRTLLRRLEERAAQSTGKVILLSHTAPRYEPDTPHLHPGELWVGGTTQYERFYTRATHHFYGHTHWSAARKIGETDVVCIGSGGRKFCYCVLDTETGKYTHERNENQ